MSDDETAVAVTDRDQAGVDALEHVLGTGDLAQLSNAERVGHYLRLCRSLGLNPLSRPFTWIEFERGGLQLYPNQSCAAQLRRQHQIRIEVTRREPVGEFFVVEVKGTTPDGREDFASKYVPLSNSRGRLMGQEYANAIMKAETGAKRRLTFSMVGLAVPPDPDDGGTWRPVIVDGTGMIIQQPTAEQQYLAQTPAAARAIGEPVFEDSPINEEGVGQSQAARPEEFQRARQERPRPTFKPTAEQIQHWLNSWFAAVSGSSLDHDDERHTFVRQWTESRTESLRDFFSTATARQAEDLLAHVRALVEDERKAIREAAEGMAEEDQEQEAF
jgi:hypothetical protein